MTEYYGIPTLTNRGFRFDQILFKATQEGYSYNGWTNESTKNDKWNPADGKEVSFQAKFTDYVRITENTGGAKSAVYVHYKRLNTYERAGGTGWQLFSHPDIAAQMITLDQCNSL